MRSVLDRPSNHGYGTVAIAFHWATAILVLCAFIMGPGGSEQHVYSPARDFDRQIHEALGLTVFAMTLLRLTWRLLVSPPVLQSSPRWLVRLSRTVQAALYALLFITPATAVLGAWLEGHPLTLWLLGNVPPLIPEFHALGRSIAEVHTILGDTVMWVAGFHAAAGLFHHFVLKDAVLLSMVPAGLRNRII